MSKDLYEQLSDIEQQAKLTFEGLSEMKAVLAEVLEKNAELKIENKHLREHLQELEPSATPQTGKEGLKPFRNQNKTYRIFTKKASISARTFMGHDAKITSLAHFVMMSSTANEQTIKKGRAKGMLTFGLSLCHY